MYASIDLHRKKMLYYKVHLLLNNIVHFMNYIYTAFPFPGI